MSAAAAEAEKKSAGSPVVMAKVSKLESAAGKTKREVALFRWAVAKDMAGEDIYGEPLNDSGTTPADRCDLISECNLIK